MPPEDMSEFEQEMADIEDPSPFTFQGVAPSGVRIIELFNEVIDLVTSDVVDGFNKTGSPIVQYIAPSTGATITVAIPATRLMNIRIQLPPEVGEFITLTEAPPDE